MQLYREVMEKGNQNIIHLLFEFNHFLFHHWIWKLMQLPFTLHNNNLPLQQHKKWGKFFYIVYDGNHTNSLTFFNLKKYWFIGVLNWENPVDSNLLTMFRKNYLWVYKGPFKSYVTQNFLFLTPHPTLVTEFVTKNLVKQDVLTKS